MKRTLALTALILWQTPLVLADTPDYSKRTNIYNSTSLTPLPFASFINVDTFKSYKQCTSQGKAAHECPKYDFTVPYSLDTETIRVAQDLRTAWQRLEERYYWRALVRLNNPIMNVTHCMVDWSGGKLQAHAPDLTLNTDNTMFPAELAGKIPLQPPEDRLQMDRYQGLPQVPNGDYCTDLNWDFSLMYLPGTCVWSGGVKVFCIEGTTPSLNPLAPAPLGFRFDLANQRILQAVKEANTTYTADYVKDVARALAPNGKFSPLLWSTLNNAVVAPTMKVQPDFSFIQKEAQEAGNHLGGLFKGTAYAYYLQGLSGPAAALRVHTLPASHDTLGVANPPGVWKLEEFKRRFPVNSAALYERFGYTTLFEAWNEVRPRLLPEEASAKPHRQMVYQALGHNFYAPSPFPVTVPAPMLIPQYSAGLPYSGPQTRFAWTSVAEGYPVPRVAGQPATDYGAITR